ncbi:MAG: phosphoribosyltransferase [Candidatus Omnitrophica bacterium]|nr:phosphoribosyltransferase [Candidatus Omnitrophota bacterium]
MFRNRKDAGQQLAGALENYRGTGALVLAVPRGGVEIGYEVASALGLDLSVIITRKLPFPEQPEAGFGALAEDGSSYVNEEAVRWMETSAVKRVTEQQKEEIARRIQLYRGGQPLPSVSGRHVILVDDGIAMGSTVNASILLLKNRNAKKITVASPVAGPEIAGNLEKAADEVVVLEKPPAFRAVAQVYENWYDVPDHEVLEILDKWKKRGSST